MQIDESFNRTFMELKYSFQDQVAANLGFNRTFMELKYLE